jgi:hypothetical protein
MAILRAALFARWASTVQVSLITGRHTFSNVLTHMKMMMYVCVYEEDDVCVCLCVCVCVCVQL